MKEGGQEDRRMYRRMKMFDVLLPGKESNHVERKQIGNVPHLFFKM